MRIMKRRIEVIRETHEITIIRTNGNRQKHFCENCRQNVSAFTLVQIASFFQKDVREICRMIEAENFHLVSAERGIAFICGKSLNNSCREIN